MWHFRTSNIGLIIFLRKILNLKNNLSCFLSCIVRKFLVIVNTSLFLPPTFNQLCHPVNTLSTLSLCYLLALQLLAIIYFHSDTRISLPWTWSTRLYFKKNPMSVSAILIFLNDCSDHVIFHLKLPETPYCLQNIVVTERTRD